ncbi:hydrogenase-1 expression HyaE [Terasakiella sp. SH-1]|uniref:hydrogenase-1 expression HyaE n=1 Tax=Terasakiella sp. SH-1 TaxID=2560057 RepID=UPI00142F9B30|nr:hydrogenase-1 expression HyaE [Terasakiella sp. SH-1]
MFSPLLESIIERDAIPVVDETGLEAFCVDNELVVLMVTGDYKRVSTANDLAVILPELVKTYQGQFKPCISQRETEAAFQAKFNFVLLPTLVFLKGEDMLGTISGIMEWSEFITKTNEIVAHHLRTNAAQ